MIRQGLIFFGLFLALPFLCSASDQNESDDGWRLFSRLGNDKITLISYYYNQKVEFVDENICRIWLKEESKISYETEFVEFNCSEKKVRRLQSTILNITTGEIKEEFDMPYRYVVPGSFDDKYMTIVCAIAKASSDSKKSSKSDMFPR